MNLTPVKTPQVVKKMFPNFVWDIKTTKKEIFLTFDDGPTPEITSWTLDILKQYNAKATFFCIGNNVEKYPEIFQKILLHGHAIGNHTQNHLKGWATKTKDYLNDVEKAHSVLRTSLLKGEPKLNVSEIKNHQSLIPTNLFRPPYGKLIPKQSNALLKLGYKIIMWNVLSIDWDKRISKEDCLKNVLDNTTNGSIVVFHDSIKAKTNMQYSLPKVLEYFSKKGFEFKAIKL